MEKGALLLVMMLLNNKEAAVQGVLSESLQRYHFPSTNCKQAVKLLSSKRLCLCHAIQHETMGQAGTCVQGRWESGTAHLFTNIENGLWYRTLIRARSDPTPKATPSQGDCFQHAQI